VSPVTYELGFYITEDDILHSGVEAERKLYNDLQTLHSYA
jgi:hypothetical protein